MVKPSNENIDFSTWPTVEQEQAYSELEVLLAKPPGFNPPTMTDQQLTDALAAIVAEMATRPGGTSQPATVTTFGQDTIFKVL